MKKSKKLSQGMTLVEVMISMTIFAFMAACIMTVIGQSIRSSERSKRRDMEVAQQANAVEKKSDAGASVYDTNTYDLKFTLQNGSFSDGTNQKTVSGIQQYKADWTAQFGEDFGFNLKFFDNGAVLGSSAVDLTHSDTKYDYSFKIIVENQSAEDISVKTVVPVGYIFEGSVENGYVHSSSVYNRNIIGMGNIEFGYCNQNYSGLNGSVTAINIQILVNNVTRQLYVTKTEMDQMIATDKNTITFTYTNTGLFQKSTS